jgi:hypothetical protein
MLCLAIDGFHFLNCSLSFLLIDPVPVDTYSMEYSSTELLQRQNTVWDPEVQKFRYTYIKRYFPRTILYTVPVVQEVYTGISLPEHLISYTSEYDKAAHFNCRFKSNMASTLINGTYD